MDLGTRLGDQCLDNGPQREFIAGDSGASLPGIGHQQGPPGLGGIMRRPGLGDKPPGFGRGGMGAVYLAEREDGEFKRQAAIKLVRRYGYRHKGIANGAARIIVCAWTP